MISEIGAMFSKMIGTLAVILVVSAFIGGSDLLTKLLKNEKKWMYWFIPGILGGLFGIYGNISGFNVNGAVISVRNIGPMLAGASGGPVAGLIAGIIAGVHRLTLGGITAWACIVATCCIGLMCGFVSKKFPAFIEKPYCALLVSALMETFHLGVVLVMVKPFESALDIVKQIAIPFVAVNALGFMLMISIITYTEKQRKLAEEKTRLQSELEVANVIQHSLLPLLNDEYPDNPNIEVSASMEAAKEVGGDFYDVFYVDPDHLAFVIGDVSGKGVPAALFMASSKITLQNCIRDIPSLSDAVSTANNALCQRNEAEMFVTLWVGVLDVKTGEMRFISAGHNPAVHSRAGKADYLKVKSGFVLGGMEGMRYRENSVTLENGDVICIYTDGVTEAEDKTHALFGEERLLECFKDKSNNSPAELIDGVKRAVDVFINGNAQFDDMTMLCFKWRKIL